VAIGRNLVCAEGSASGHPRPFHAANGLRFSAQLERRWENLVSVKENS